MLFTVNTTIELICFLVACVCLHRDKSAAWRLMIPYLALVCLTEITGIYLRKHLHVSNTWLYNVYQYLELTVIWSFLYFNLKPYVTSNKWYYIILAGLWVIFITETYIRGWNVFANISASVMSIVFIITSLYYFLLVIRDEAYLQLSTHAPFWWVSGTLLYYFGSTASNVFFDFLISGAIMSLPFPLRYIVFNILNVLLYCCWSYSFLCRFRQRNSSSSLV
ncbi:hypothetical protein [Chitinophaga sp. sic0106]|uniref:hypothetical protein n=1 Tax=Chitinophaga sp. sic0106 TaxID=2854785 RepID=UPI001C47FBF7|nr:hypothetical protein [Chitinophaga sp. sic0106]MBV7532191.1 hypothetical protein [Chitinophaga sp. sic0106]